MKLVRMGTKEVFMAYVKPACWEKKMTRQDELKGRVGFVGKRYCANFESLALFNLLVIIDSNWAC